MTIKNFKLDVPELIRVSSGKVREIFCFEGYEDEIIIVATDRISAFDQVLDDPIPGKGKILTQISKFWFEFLGDIIPSHFISSDINALPMSLMPFDDILDGRTILARSARVLPIECIVRGYISGSAWKEYQSSGAVCGQKLPEGMVESERFPVPIFTPSTKAELGGRDENISFSQMAEVVSNDLACQMRNASLSLYEKAAEYALEKGIIIADTKFEFGLDQNNELILIDEVLTPDSSRFWPVDKYRLSGPQPSFDKQYLRDYLTSVGFTGEPGQPIPKLPGDIILKTANLYQEALERLIGNK